MAIYLEMPNLDPKLGFKFLINEGDILTTPYWHREYELILLTKGKVNIGINDKQFQLSAGGMAFFKGGDIHYIVATPDSNRFVFQFDMSLFNENVVKKMDLASHLNKLSQVSLFWDEKINRKLRTILHQIVNEESNNQYDKEFVIEGLMYRLIACMLRELPKDDEVKVPGINIQSKTILITLNKVFSFVEKNYRTKVTLEDVSKAAGFSPYYFTKFLKKNVGQTFIEFLNNYRIDKAKWEIINTDTPISSILNQGGFTSDKTFYRLFKKQVGLSPKQYKNKYNLVK